MSLFFESNNLTLGYGNQLVIKNLDISLNFSKNYEITGKNGSGKTTLIMCISNNFIGNTFKSNIRRKDISLMEIGSSTSLMPELSLLDNIKYFLFNDNINENMIKNVLNKYELESFKSDLVGDFSSGMLKRSEIAIAELKNPKVLCIDEPRVYLDKNGVELLLNLITKREKEGSTSILSSQESIGAFTSIERSFNLND